jgi:hypothetical protein
VVEVATAEVTAARSVADTEVVDAIVITDRTAVARATVEAVSLGTVEAPSPGTAAAAVVVVVVAVLTVAATVRKLLEATEAVRNRLL